MNNSIEGFHDLWDEDMLVKSYNKAFNIANGTLAKHIAMKTNKASSSTITNQDDNDNGEHNVSAINDLNDEQLENEVNEESDATIPVEVSLKAGDYVRATYVDGIDYEAKILSINLKNATAIVKYIGYNNEQEVPLSNLISSWGRKARKLQLAKAKSTPVIDKEFIPPPPPIPPAVNTDCEHLSAMLISWYMSGYYTGVYQTLQNNQIRSRKRKLKPRNK